MTLGEDLEGLEDQSSYPAALPGFDITAVKVRRIGGSIEFRFEFADLEDPLDHSPHAGVPFSISVSWWFNTQENLDDWFVGAEIDPVEQIFFLKRYDEAVRENSWVVSGAYDAAGDFVSVTVPIDLLGGAGTTLSRCRVDGGMCNDPTVAESDVRVWAHPYPHLHDADPSPTSPTGSGDPALLDYLSTDRSYKIR